MSRWVAALVALLALCATCGATLVEVLDREPPPTGELSVAGAASAAQKAAKAAKAAAQEADELAETPQQKEEARRLELQAKTMMTDAEQKQQLANPGAPSAKSADQLEDEAERREEEAERLNQAKAFVAKTNSDLVKQKARDAAEVKQKADYRQQAATPPPITQETLEKAVAKQKHDDWVQLQTAKAKYHADLHAQKVNLTRAAEHTLQTVKEQAEKDVAAIHSQALFDKKQMELQREQDAVLAEKQVTTNSLLKARLAASAESSQIKAAASQQAAAMVADEAQQIADKYPSAATEHAAKVDRVEELKESARTIRLKKMARTAVLDAQEAKSNADAAAEKSLRLKALKTRMTITNTTTQLAADKEAQATTKKIEAHGKLTEHEMAIAQSVSDFNTARNELKKANHREKETKSVARDVSKRVAHATKQEENASNDSERLKAQEVKYKASGDVRVAELKANDVKLQKAKAEADANYRKIELGKLRMQGRKVKEASIEASNKKDAATKEHVAAQKAAKAVVMEARKVHSELKALHKKEENRERSSKREIQKAAVESQQDAHETTAKAAAKAKAVALFKIEQTKMKSREHSELSAKAAHAKAVVDGLVAKRKGNVNAEEDQESMGEAGKPVKPQSLSKIMRSAKSIIDRVAKQNENIQKQSNYVKSLEP